MELQIINDSGKSSDTVKVSDEFFAREYNEALVHQLSLIHI